MNGRCKMVRIADRSMRLWLVLLCAAFWLLFYVGTVFRLYSSRVNNRHWNALNSPMDRGFNTNRQLAKLRGTRQTVPFYRHLWRVLHALFIIGNEISSSYTVDFSRFNLWFLRLLLLCWKMENRFGNIRLVVRWDDNIIQKRSKETIVGTQRFLLITVRNSTWTLFYAKCPCII